jgi:hypothetical protein
MRWVAVIAAYLAAATASAQPDAPAEPSAVEQSPPAPSPTVAVEPVPVVNTSPSPISDSLPSAVPVAEEASPEPPSSLSGPTLPFNIQLHGFVSEGGFKSTANEFIGSSSRGSLKFFEGAINFSAELTDQLRVGLQLVSRSVGTLSEEVPRLDWAVIDYRPLAWLGLRAGVIKMPLGLYNESIGVDASRTAILLPQSLYPIRNRDALLSHTGFSLYGSLRLAEAGALDYQAWLGTLAIPRSALELSGGSLDGVDTHYATGGQVFWRILDGLRIGASYMRAHIDFDVQLDPKTVDAVVMAGVVPSTFQGELLVSQRPTSSWVASAEYIHNAWTFAAEYSRWAKRQVARPKLIADVNEDSERFYAMGSYRFSPYLEAGAYYSVSHADADDRRGEGAQYAKRFLAFQRDLAATLRLDINEYWLWKLEGHFVDGVSDLQSTRNPKPKRYWGLFLFKTTVTF